jgi:hypothetical protein
MDHLCQQTKSDRRQRDVYSCQPFEDREIGLDPSM